MRRAPHVHRSNVSISAGARGYGTKKRSFVRARYSNFRRKESKKTRGSDTRFSCVTLVPLYPAVAEVSSVTYFSLPLSSLSLIRPLSLPPSPPPLFVLVLGSRVSSLTSVREGSRLPAARVQKGNDEFGVKFFLSKKARR